MRVRMFSAWSMMAAIGLAAIMTAPAAAQQENTITYQGHLEFEGQPYTGSADMIFELADDQFAGNITQSTLRAGVQVSKGVFTELITLGIAASGGPSAQRWLQIKVRTPAYVGPPESAPPFHTLTPRQPLTRSPYAIHTRGIEVSSGNLVGMGRSPTGARLSVQSPGGAEPAILTSGGMDIAALDGEPFTIGQFNTVTSAFTPRVNITEAGLLGIGTLSPVARLHVAGDVALGAGDREMRLFEVAATDPRWSSMVAFGGIGIGSDTGGNRQAVLITDGVANNNVFTVTSSLNSGTTWLPRLTVRQDGAVAIGSASGTGSLEVVGGVRARGGVPGAFGVGNAGYAFTGTGDNDSGLFSLGNGEVSIFTDGQELVKFSSTQGVVLADGTAFARIVASMAGVSVDFPSIGGGGRAAAAFGLAGAQVGDVVVLSPRTDVPFPYILHGAHVSAPNTVRFVLHNVGPSAVDPPAFQFDLFVLRR